MIENFTDGAGHTQGRARDREHGHEWITDNVEHSRSLDADKVIQPPSQYDIAIRDPALTQGELFALPPSSGAGCRRCGQSKTTISWHVGDGIKHLRESCARCGAYIKWLPQTPENVARDREWRRERQKNAGGQK